MGKQSGKNIKTGIIWLAWSGAIAIAGVGGFLIYSRVFNSAQNAPVVSVVPVELKDVKDPIYTSGTVKLADQQTLKSPVERGVVERVQVQVNDTVTVGELLITLRDPERETTLIRQQLGIQQKELLIANAREDVVEAKESLESAQRELETATLDGEIDIRKQQLQLERDREKIIERQAAIAGLETELQKSEELLERGFISEQEFQGEKNAVSDAKSNLRDAQLEVSNSQLDLESSQRQLETERDTARKSILEAKSAFRKAQLTLNNELQNLKELRLDLSDAEKKLEENFVRSTLNGRVMDIQVKPGDVVEGGTSLLTLGNPSQEEVILQLNTLDAARVKVNQKVIVKVIGPNAQEFTGRVETIAQIVASSDDDSSQGQGGGIAATIELNSPSQSLIPNSQVDVEIIIEEREKVVALATELIQREGEAAFVWVRNDQGKAEKRSITLGLEGVTAIEVTSGLKVGEQVVLPTPDLNLEPEMSLTINGEQ